MVATHSRPGLLAGAVGVDGVDGYSDGFSPWDEFDPRAYLEHNYASLRDDDRQIIEAVRDFFTSCDIPAGTHGIDVGTGSNLYPALTMLPFCSDVTLYEYSTSNLEWLEQQSKQGWPTWQLWEPFWNVLSKQEPYTAVEDPRALLSELAKPVHGDIFSLPEKGRRWGVGTMFFVAESITHERTEFRRALASFVDGLAAGAPFAIALMEHSRGYEVAGHNFPATDIGESDVARCLHERAQDVTIKVVDTGETPIRDGVGMIIALGRAGGPR